MAQVLKLEPLKVLTREDLKGLRLESFLHDIPEAGQHGELDQIAPLARAISSRGTVQIRTPPQGDSQHTRLDLTSMARAWWDASRASPRWDSTAVARATLLVTPCQGPAWGGEVRVRNPNPAWGGRD